MAKILIVDDSDDLLETLTMMLKVKEHEIITSNNFSDTVKSILSFHPDLLILDVLLGNSKGREMCKSIKKFFPVLPILLMSANPELLKDFEACNADAILEKPFDMYKLNDTINGLLKRKLQNI